ncbi:MAG TPA: LLM class flavin-dependent oxidoreductase [Ktedonobacteraceae bacterium]|nr:LLM class flavin-dependent oxidoreductase [Ktedonobacteraceae bacterium]
MSSYGNQTQGQVTAKPRAKRDRIGLAIAGGDVAAAVEQIVEAEAAGLSQIWMTQGTPGPDTLTIFTAAAMKTSRIRLGTAIVPTYPRHPLALAQQALTLEDLAPGRLRLGIGPSHRPIIEGVYGIPMKTPLEHLREYIAILRGLLWQGNVDHHGQFYSVKSTFPRTPQTPILISGLREGAYQLAGEVADGVISWVSPVPFIVQKAAPALREGAARSGRTAPPVIAHIPVAFSADRSAVLAATSQQLGYYGRLPFYANMFADAGFPVEAGGKLSEALIDNLVVSGNEETIQARLNALLEQGLDELLIMPITVADASAEQKHLTRLLGQM